MKNILALALATVLLAGVLIGCGGPAADTSATTGTTASAPATTGTTAPAATTGK